MQLINSTTNTNHSTNIVCYSMLAVLFTNGTKMQISLPDFAYSIALVGNLFLF